VRARKGGQGAAIFDAGTGEGPEGRTGPRETTCTCRTSTSRASRPSIADKGEPPTHPLYKRPPSAAVPAPKTEAEFGGRSGRISFKGLKDRFIPIALVAIVVLLVTLAVTSGPRFTAGNYPVTNTGALRPLPLVPNQNITVAFGTLGPKAPKANPDSPRLARYTYGSDLSVDAANGIIYAVTVRVPNRSWRGLHAGLPEETARGVLARLGSIREPEGAAPAPPQEVGGYWVYPSLDERPARVLQVSLRPPNGCFDVQVELRPQAIGLLDDGGDTRYAVVGRESSALNWVVHQVRVVSRSVRGPYSGVPAC